MRRTFKIDMDIPSGTEPQDVAEYLFDAANGWRGSYDFADPRKEFTALRVRHTVSDTIFPSQHHSEATWLK